MNATAAQLDKRNELLVRLAESRSATDDLFQMVHADALYDRPIPERHRIVFYIGHLEAFDWNLIACLLSALIRWAAAFHRTNPPTGPASLRSTPIASTSARNSIKSSKTVRRLRRTIGNIPKRWS